MYSKAIPFSLTLAMLVRDQVLSLLSELKEHLNEWEPTGKAQQKLKNGWHVWIEFFITMAHCLLQALDLLSIGVAVLHLPTQWALKKHSLYIVKRIAILEFLTRRHQLRSQFPYLLCKFGIVREFIPKTLFWFCYNSFIKQVQPCNLKSLEKPLLAAHREGINLIKMLFLSIHPPYISWFCDDQSNFF